jgi:hypothetical protein
MSILGTTAPKSIVIRLIPIKPMMNLQKISEKLLKMAIRFGHTRHKLRVNLNDKKIDIDEISDTYARK